MSDQQLRTQTSSLSSQVLEPDQVTGIPTSAAEVGKEEIQTELGGTGTVIVNGFLTGQDYNKELTGTKRIDIYDQMRLSDATVRAGLNVVKLAILSADWYIKGPTDSDKPTPATEFTDRQLFKSQTFSWTTFLRQALTMCDYGNAIFEKVFETLPDGKIGWKRLAPRLSKTIYRWTLQDGKSPGIYQILPTGKTAEIPRWKLLYFINEQEGSNYEGISLLRAPYKHYYYKDLYYKIDAISAEKQGVGIPKITRPPNAQQQDIAKMREIARNMRANEQTYIEVPTGFEFEFMDTHAEHLKDTKDMVDHHDRQISKAFLAQFLDLGTKAGGSYALSASQSELFLLGLEYIAKLIQEEMNHAIRELCDLNFPGLGEDDYPTLDYGAIGQIDYEQVSSALESLSKAGMITPTVETEKYLRASMKLPELDESDLPDYGEDDVDPEGESESLGRPKAKQPNNPVQPNNKAEPKAKKNIQATEFMEDIMEFHEQLEQAIAEKRTHATGD
jgi:hypothetical protein